MGMDTVELVMKVEEVFGVDLIDQELNRVGTAGELLDLVLKKQKRGGIAVCRTSAAFYRVRRVLGARVRPATLLDDAIPNVSRCAKWSEFEQASGLVWPSLRHSRRVKNLIPASSLVLCLSAMLWGVGIVWILPLLLASLILSTIALRFVPATDFPRDAQTVGDLARLIAAKNHRRLPGRSDSEVWLVLRRIIADQTGLREDEIHTASRFGDDLNMD